MHARSTARWALAASLVAVALSIAACATTARRGVPPGTPQPDKYLFDRGTDALQSKKWIVARDFFKQLSENYTQSPYRPDAKLGTGDTYMGEGSTSALVLAINEYQEFLSYYPTHPRADYAQYKIAMAHFRQMRNPERDQTETRDAVKEFQTFVVRYPNSSLLTDARSKLRTAQDRLSQSDYLVGVFYFKIRWYPGAVDRLNSLLKQDPAFTGRDGVYFYLGESLIKLKRDAEALPYYEKLVAEFEQSEHLEDARKRIDELKAAQAKQS
jgi:outer membrane protein assembly factor BamD